jgi:hypothetical protein
MSKLDDVASSGQVEKITPGETIGNDFDAWAASFSSLLTLPPDVPFNQYQHGERRSGQDRRARDRRLTAPEFTVSE